LEVRYPLVEKARILEFLEMKGLTRPRAESSAFFNSGDDSPVVSIDVESERVDLNHLVEDWATVGAQSLADELLTWLGAHPNF
jgi:hypothetical protein